MLNHIFHHPSPLHLLKTLQGKPVKVKNKARGRNKIGKKLKKAQQNIMTLEKEKLLEKLEKQRQAKKQEMEIAKQKRKKALQGGGGGTGGSGSDTGADFDGADAVNPLARFKKRRLSSNK